MCDTLADKKINKINKRNKLKKELNRNKIK